MIAASRNSLLLFCMLIFFGAQIQASDAECVAKEYSVSGNIDSREIIRPESSVDEFRWRDSAQSLDVSDSVGEVHRVQFHFVRRSDAEWQVCLVAGPDGRESCRSVGNLYFDENQRQKGSLKLPFEADWALQEVGSIYVFVLNDLQAEPQTQNLTSRILSNSPIRCIINGRVDEGHEVTGGVINRYTEGVFNEDSD